MQPELEGRQVEIIVEEMPACLADPTLLKQVYSNLLSNAFKFTQHQGEAKVIVGSQEEQGEKVYFVRDNGVGFDMGYEEEVFGVFQRLHNDGEYKGTGAGLAIVQRIIQRHGGRIWVQSAVGKGATFYFTFGE
jgi:light-regulated signal transduction histidine kinase (bacteriophytochrome)